MRPALLTVAVLFVVAQPALADHCTSYTTSVNDFPEGEHFVYSPELDTPAFHTKDDIYLVIDFCQPGCVAFGAVYEETNRLPGLQREDGLVNDQCHDSIQADTRLTQFGVAFE